MLQAAQGTRAVDIAAVGEQSRGTRHRRARERLNDRRTLKKTVSSPIAGNAGSSPRRPTARSSPPWRTCWPSTRSHAIRISRWFAWTRPQSNCLPKRACRSPMKAGRPARFDYECECNDTANLFLMFAPLEGWRPCQSHGSSHRRRLCERLEGVGRYSLRQRGAGSGRPQTRPSLRRPAVGAKPHSVLSRPGWTLAGLESGCLPIRHGAGW
jgi:hypothetical protein